MLKKAILFLYCAFLGHSLLAQEELIQSFLIPSELTDHANAVVRMNDTHITIKNASKMIYKNKRIVTILNASGDSKHGAYMYYDDVTTINAIDARIYDKFGELIKKIRYRDFVDQSAVDGGTLYSDSRIKFLDYTPVSYPYTIVFETEVMHSSTAFIRSWSPIEGFYVSTQNASYFIENLSEIELKIKTDNFEEFGITRHSATHFSAKNLKVLRPEAYRPSFEVFAPKLKATLTEFELEGVPGTNHNWLDFGKWMNDKLIQGTQELPETLKSEIKALTAHAKSDIEKAKIVYQYMQNKTRYISVQVGIGGWKPMLASDVDRLGYGDCKGLTNYTKAMLDAIGVENYYTVIHGGKDIVDIDDSFSSVQGNHVILCVPDDSDYLWLECTNQIAPFAYNANFTDDRDALIITPEGGKIVHTKVYETSENLLKSNANISIDEAGNFKAAITSKSYGTQYGKHRAKSFYDEKDKILSYKNYWSYINSLDVETMLMEDDKDSIVFTETVHASAKRYAAKAGKRLLLQPNVFNRIESVPKRYDNRTLPFEIDRGFTDVDQYQIKIPETFEVEALMNPVVIESQFGTYKAAITQAENNTLVYDREFILNKGNYSKDDYEAFRLFLMDVVKHDKSKIVIKPKT